MMVEHPVEGMADGSTDDHCCTESQRQDLEGFPVVVHQTRLMIARMTTTTSTTIRSVISNPITSPLL